MLERIRKLQEEKLVKEAKRSEKIRFDDFNDTYEKLGIKEAFEEINRDLLHNRGQMSLEHIDAKIYPPSPGRSDYDKDRFAHGEEILILQWDDNKQISMRCSRGMTRLVFKFDYTGKTPGFEGISIDETQSEKYYVDKGGFIYPNKDYSLTEIREGFQNEFAQICLNMLEQGLFTPGPSVIYL